MFKRFLIAIELLAKSVQVLALAVEEMNHNQKESIELAKRPTPQQDPAKMVKDLMASLGKGDLLKNFGKENKQ